MPEWLEEERLYYASLTKELESKVLVMSVDKMRILSADEGMKDEELWEYKANCSWKAIGYELHELPSAFSDIYLDGLIEWTYLVDLDHERFSVNNSIHFDLWNIHHPRWMKAFKYNEDGELTVFSDIVPGVSDRLKPPRDFADDEWNKYHAMYQQYKCSKAQAIGGGEFSPQDSLQQLIATIVLEELSQPDASRYLETLPVWGDETFAFREMAFAILSLASVRFYFDTPYRFYGYRNGSYEDGYLIDRDGDGGPHLMPLFGSGYHMQDQNPGSAPQDSMYWFANVLVSLVSNTVFQNDAEAAIAKAVAYGLAESHQNFQIVLFSILNAICLEVIVADGVTHVRRTGHIPILSTIWDESDADSGNSENGDRGLESPLAQIRRRHQGFITLQNFFSTAVKRKVSVFNQGLFPTEIYAEIIKHIDYSTLDACRQVSPTFHLLCRERFPFSPDLTMLDIEASTMPKKTQERGRRRPWKLADIGTFVFQVQNTGLVQRSGLSVDRKRLSREKSSVTTWCPVVGSVARPSMMTKIRLQSLLH